MESEGPGAAIGDFCEVWTSNRRRLRAQVIGFRDGRVLSLPLEEIDGLQAGDPIVARSAEGRLAVGSHLLGRVLDGFGKPLDGRPLADSGVLYDLYKTAPGPLELGQL